MKGKRQGENIVENRIHAWIIATVFVESTGENTGREYSGKQNSCHGYATVFVESTGITPPKEPK